MKAVITLTDSEDGESADVSVEFDPPITDETDSTAQLLAIKMVERVAAPDELEAARFTTEDPS